MRYAPSLGHIILVLLLLVTLAQAVEWLLRIWDERLVPRRRVRPGRNPKRNRERWARRWARWRRRQPRVSRAERGRRRVRILRQILSTPSGPTTVWPREALKGCEPLPAPTTMNECSLTNTDIEQTDPLAELRQSRGWVDHMDERELWAMLIQVRWPHGAECPCCGEDEPRYLKMLDADYRGGLGRWQCQVCAGAGEPGEGGTFTSWTGCASMCERCG